MQRFTCVVISTWKALSFTDMLYMHRGKICASLISDTHHMWRDKSDAHKKINGVLAVNLLLITSARNFSLLACNALKWDRFSFYFANTLWVKSWLKWSFALSEFTLHGFHNGNFNAAVLLLNSSFSPYSSFPPLHPFFFFYFLFFIYDMKLTWQQTPPTLSSKPSVEEQPLVSPCNLRCVEMATGVQTIP